MRAQERQTENKRERYEKAEDEGESESERDNVVLGNVLKISALRLTRFCEHNHLGRRSESETKLELKLTGTLG